MVNLASLSSDDQELVTQIKQKVDGIAMLSAQENDPCKTFIYSPASMEEIQWAEAGISASLPPLIREIFLQVGNGGFGPGYVVDLVFSGHLRLSMKCRRGLSSGMPRACSKRLLLPG